MGWTRMCAAPPGAVAEWLRSGLQSRVHRFDSGRRLWRNLTAGGPRPRRAGGAERGLCRPRRLERQRRGQGAVGVDLAPAFGQLLFGLGDRVGPGEKPERRPLLVGDGQQRLGELDGVAALLAVHALPELALGDVALGVVLDR